MTIYFKDDLRCIFGLLFILEPFRVRYWWGFEDNGPKYYWGFLKGGSVCDFLRIVITPGSGGGYKCTKEGFIKRVIENSGMNKLNKVLTLTK